MSGIVDYGYVIPEPERELHQQVWQHRYDTGFLIQDDELAAGTVFHTLCPLRVDFKLRTAQVVKNVKLTAAHANNAATIQIEKYSLIQPGMAVGDGSNRFVINSIDRTNPNYDTLTATGTVAFPAIPAGTVLWQTPVTGTPVGLPTRTANALNMNYNTVVGPNVSLSALWRAVEIQEDRLYHPISSKDKETLNGVFIFI
jgi:hypothetical protein